MSGMPSSTNVVTPFPRVSFRFRLVHILYITALFASAFALFGVAGIVAGALVLGVWVPVFISLSRPRAIQCLVDLLPLVLLTILFAGLTTWCAVMSYRANSKVPSRITICENNLRQIAAALHAYHQVNGEFPPANVADKQGRPMHSWRVLILPHLDQPNLFAAYNFNEPWDGPNNRKLLGHMPKVYQCPGHVAVGTARQNCTSYVAVVGEGTIWPGAGSVALTDIKDGPDHTILLIEDNAAQIPWTQPTDWSLDEALKNLTSTDPKNCSPHGQIVDDDLSSSTRNIAMANFHVGQFDDAPRRDRWLHLLTIDGGDDVWLGQDEICLLPRPGPSRVGLVLRVAAFIVLALSPLPWVWLNPTSRGMRRALRSVEPAA